MAFLKSISDHLAKRSSLERMKISRVSLVASRVRGCPLYASSRSSSSEMHLRRGQGGTGVSPWLTRQPYPWQGYR